MSQDGSNNVILHDLKSMAINEYKIELNTEYGGDRDFPFDFKKLIGIEYFSGGYYNFEIIPNNTNLVFEPVEENYKHKK